MQMEKHRYPKPLDTLERITCQDLCNKTDIYFARMETEDTGFVILDDSGKDSLVLCPATWLEYPLELELLEILNLRLRYLSQKDTIPRSPNSKEVTYGTKIGTSIF